MTIRFSGVLVAEAIGCVLRRNLLRVATVHFSYVFFFQAEDGIRDIGVTGVQTCALPICSGPHAESLSRVIADEATTRLRDSACGPERSWASPTFPGFNVSRSVRKCRENSDLGQHYRLI